MEQKFEDNRVIAEPNDYKNESDLLHCGNCREPKEQVILNSIQPRLCTCQLIKATKDRRENDPFYKEQEKIRIEQIRKYGLLGDKYEGYIVERDDHSNPFMSNLVEKYVANFDEIKANNNGLLLYGGVGTGKTFYAVSIANALVDKGKSVLVTNMSSLISQLQRNNFDQIETNRIYNRIRNVELLVLDDLASESNSAFRTEQTYNIINTRYMSDKPIIVTTNLSLNTMKNTTEISQQRIYDRIFEMCTPLQVTGATKRRTGENTKDLFQTLGVAKPKQN